MARPTKKQKQRAPTTGLRASDELLRRVDAERDRLNKANPGARYTRHGLMLAALEAAFPAAKQEG